MTEFISKSLTDSEHKSGRGRAAFNEILCQVKERHFQNIPDT